ncbi:MAG: histidinol-phosphate transaminase [Campylobacterales bacterium]|nr:histidinol-phosphate transaminase [Campylobacterales bacterium]
MKFKDTLKDIKTYSAGKPIELVVRDYGVAPENIIKLASNENPHGCSPKVREKISQIVGNMYRYPDDSFFELKEKLSTKFGVKDTNIIIGAGSDQTFEFISRALLEEGDKVLVNRISFAMYDIYAKQEGAVMIKTDTIEHDLDQFKTLYQEHKPKLVYICTPSNPAGDALDKVDVYDFLKTVDPETMVVVDGAYMEYASFKEAKKLIEPKDLIDTFPNCIYTGTFSKAYGLGGMRTGYAIASEEFINSLLKMRPPFNITTLSLAAAVEACNDEEFVTFAIDDCFKEMKRYEDFAKENNFDYIDSYTNFITLMLNDSMNSSEISEALLKKGVIVRDLGSYSMNAIRVTIGTTAENDRFFKIFKEVLGN